MGRRRRQPNMARMTHVDEITPVSSDDDLLAYPWQANAATCDQAEYLMILIQRKLELQQLDLVETRDERHCLASAIDAVSSQSAETAQVEVGGGSTSPNSQLPVAERNSAVARTVARGITVGARCNVVGYDIPGTVRFVGLVQTGSPQAVCKVGIELDAPFGKNNGSVGGHEYFKADTDCGVFVSPRKVKVTASEDDLASIPALPPKPNLASHQRFGDEGGAAPTEISNEGDAEQARGDSCIVQTNFSIETDNEEDDVTEVANATVVASPFQRVTRQVEHVKVKTFDDETDEALAVANEEGDSPASRAALFSTTPVASLFQDSAVATLMNVASWSAIGEDNLDEDPNATPTDGGTDAGVGQCTPLASNEPLTLADSVPAATVVPDSVHATPAPALPPAAEKEEKEGSPVPAATTPSTAEEKVVSPLPAATTPPSAEEKGASPLPAATPPQPPAATVLSPVPAASTHPSEVATVPVPAVVPHTTDTHECLGWSSTKVVGWLLENDLEKFEDDVEDWDGRALYKLAMDMRVDTKALDAALADAFVLMGKRDCRKARDSWKDAFENLVGTPPLPSSSLPAESVAASSSCTQRQPALAAKNRPPAARAGSLADEVHAPANTKAATSESDESTKVSATYVSRSKASEGSVHPRRAVVRRPGAKSKYSIAKPAKLSGTSPPNSRAPSRAPTMDPRMSNGLKGAASIGNVATGTHSQDVVLTLLAGDDERIDVPNRLFYNVDVKAAGAVPSWVQEQYKDRVSGLSFGPGVLSDVSSLRGCTALEKLILDENALESLNSLPQLRKLRELSVRGNKIPSSGFEAAVDHISTVAPNLEVLRLGGAGDPLLLMRAAQLLPSLHFLDDADVTTAVLPIWKLPLSAWSNIARFLEVPDVVRFGACTNLTQAVAQKMKGCRPHIFPATTDTFSAGEAAKKWPNLHFTYNHFGEIKDLQLSHLVGIETLCISNAVDLQSASQFTPPISTVCRNIAINRCSTLTDVSQLEGCHGVSLRDCGNVVRVKGLNQCHAVTIVNCPQVKANDILYQLDEVPKLEVVASGKIRAVGQLGGSTVQLSDTIRGGVRQWRRLALVLEDHALLRELRGLGTVHTLTIRKCPAVLDATALRNVHTLVLDECNRLRDISALSSCVDVTLINMPRVDDVRALASCKRVRIDGCKMLSDVSPLASVAAVWITRCPSIVELKINKGHLLCVEECESLVNLEGLVNPKFGKCTIGELTLSACPNVESVVALNGAQDVTLSKLQCECNADTDLIACIRVKISECPKISGSLDRASESTTTIAPIDYIPSTRPRAHRAPELTARPPTIPSSTQGEPSTATKAIASSSTQKNPPIDTAAPKPASTTNAPAKSDKSKAKGDETFGISSLWSWLTPKPAAEASSKTLSGKTPQAKDVKPKPNAADNLTKDPKPAVKPVAEPATEPAAKPVETLAEMPVTEPVTKPVTKPVEPSVETPAKTPVTKPVEKLAEMPVETVVEKPSEEVMPSPSPVSATAFMVDVDDDQGISNDLDEAVETSEEPKAENGSSLGWKDSGVTCSSSPDESSEGDASPLSVSPEQPLTKTEPLTEMEKAALQLESEASRQDEEQKAAFNMYCSLGHDARMQKEASSATSFFFKALKIARDRSGEVSEEVASIYVNIGILYGQQKDKNKEMDYFTKALPIFQTVCGERHAMVAMTLNNLGIASRNAQEYPKSMMYFNKALEIYRDTGGEENPETIRTRRNIERLVKVASKESKKKAMA